MTRINMPSFLSRIYNFLMQLFNLNITMGNSEAMFIKSDKFNGHGFFRWQEHMEAWLITLGLITAISKEPPFTCSKSAEYSGTDKLDSPASDKPKTSKTPEEI